MNDINQKSGALRTLPGAVGVYRTPSLCTVYFRRLTNGRGGFGPQQSGGVDRLATMGTGDQWHGWFLSSFAIAVGAAVAPEQIVVKSIATNKAHSHKGPPWPTTCKLPRLMIAIGPGRIRRQGSHDCASFRLAFRKDHPRLAGIVPTSAQSHHLLAEGVNDHLLGTGETEGVVYQNHRHFRLLEPFPNRLHADQHGYIITQRWVMSRGKKRFLTGFALANCPRLKAEAA